MVNDTNTSWELTSAILYNYTKSFPTTGGQVKYLLPALYSLIFVVGFIGNALVVWVITVGTQLKVMTDVCFLNLALADLFLILSLPFRAYQMTHSWIFGKHMCTLIYGIYYIGYYGGIFFIVLMSIDRYLAIVHAVFALRIRTKTRGIVSCLVIWFLAVAASFPELLYIGIIKKSPVLRCRLKKFNSLLIFKRNIVSLLIPLIIVGFCYCMILWKLWRTHSRKKHSICLIVMVMLVFFCCWTPNNIAEFIRGLQLMDAKPAKSTKQFLQISDICRAVALSHSCMNPFLYVFMGVRFRKHLIRLVKERLLICCP